MRLEVEGEVRTSMSVDEMFYMLLIYYSYVIVFYCEWERKDWLIHLIS